jgi:hypothetical protein
MALPSFQALAILGQIVLAVGVIPLQHLPISPVALHPLTGTPNSTGPQHLPGPRANMMGRGNETINCRESRYIPKLLKPVSLTYRLHVRLRNCMVSHALGLFQKLFRVGSDPKMRFGCIA